MFAELSITSNFSFLTGASHPEEYMERAAILGLSAIAITDTNSVAGIVRAWAEGKNLQRLLRERTELEARNGPIGPPVPDHINHRRSHILTHVPRLIPGARIVTDTGFTATALASTRLGWAQLCRLITTGRRRAPKGDCHLTFDDLLQCSNGLHWLLHPPSHVPTVKSGACDWQSQARRLLRRFPGQTHVLLGPRYDGQDTPRFDRIAALAETLGLPTVASAAPIMHHGRRRKLADVVTAIRQGCRVDELGTKALANGEQRLRSEAEMCYLLGPHADAVDRAAQLAETCQFDLGQLRYEYPSEITGTETAPQRLSRLAHEGLKWRYPHGAPDKVKKLLAHELTLIGKLKYEPYFLTVRDIVAFARDRGILCQGRGSAANSVVCYCLGVTSVSPEIGTMVFERFVSEARDEPPDIDVDFEHERREEVIQHIYDRYGRHRAGLCATVIHYRGKRAIREVGSAMGLSQDTIGALSSQLWGFFSTNGLEEHRMREIGLDPNDHRLKLTMELIFEIIGFPVTSASMSAASSSPKGGWTNWSPSKTPRWKTAPSSVGTKTISTRWASSRSMCWRLACCPASARRST